MFTGLTEITALILGMCPLLGALAVLPMRPVPPMDPDDDPHWIEPTVQDMDEAPF